MSIEGINDWPELKKPGGSGHAVWLRQYGVQGPDPKQWLDRIKYLSDGQCGELNDPGLDRRFAVFAARAERAERFSVLAEVVDQYPEVEGDAGVLPAASFPWLWYRPVGLCGRLLDWWRGRGL